MRFHNVMKVYSMEVYLGKMFFSFKLVCVLVFHVQRVNYEPVYSAQSKMNNDKLIMSYKVG